MVLPKLTSDSYNSHRYRSLGLYFKVNSILKNRHGITILISNKVIYIFNFNLVSDLIFEEFKITSSKSKSDTDNLFFCYLKYLKNLLRRNATFRRDMNVKTVTVITY